MAETGTAVVHTAPPLFLRERIVDCWEAAQDLIRANQKETGTFETDDFDPNPDFYFAQEQAGVMVLFTMRVAGKLVGYQTFMLVRFHPRYRTEKNLAIQDVMYVAPEHRGIAVDHFIKFVDGNLERDGWRPIRHAAAKKPEVAKLFLHNDYEPLEQSFIKKESPVGA